MTSTRIDPSGMHDSASEKQSVLETSPPEQSKSHAVLQHAPDASENAVALPPYSASSPCEKLDTGLTKSFPTRPRRLRTRLIIGVDGTYCGPDGADTQYFGNVTNVARIFTVANDNPLGDGTWVQKLKYFPGVNNLESWIGKQMTGAFGWGIDALIKEVYRYCCTHAHHPDDEIFFFGFSRGAFVVRAVACLLHWIRVPKDMDRDFDEHYTKAIELYKDIRDGNTLRQASIYHFFRGCNTAPPVKFLGVFDTVKAFEDQSLYDIEMTASTLHARQALALHEKRRDFAPEMWSSKEGEPLHEQLQRGNQSMIQSWFYGTHSDIGGSNSRDGLSLYPLQWMLCEARDKGMLLGGFLIEDGSKAGLSNPEELIFPPSATEPYTYHFLNGVSVNMWDLRQVHRTDKHQIRVNENRGSRVIFRRRRREIFSQSRLIGYEEKEAFGTIVHPSVYMIYDTDMIIRINSEELYFHQDVAQFRQNLVLKETDRFWDVPLEEVDSRLKSVRILVCGNAGTGKSTLINKTFGIKATEESKGEHGQHDINEGLVKEDRPIIIHDSNGFQAGNKQDIVNLKQFLRNRTTTSEIPERLHAIWYCVLSTRPRTVESVDQMFFKELQACDSNVPVILIITKIDELESQVYGNAERDFRKKHDIAKKKRLTNTQLDEVQRFAEDEIRSRKATLADEFSKISDGEVVGPLFLDSDDNTSISAIMSETIQNLHNDRVSRICIAAQSCSVDLKIDAAINGGIEYYKHAARTSFAPIVGAVGGTSVGAAAVIEIMKIFGFSGFNTSVAFETLKDVLVQKRVLASGAVQGVLGIASAALATTGVGIGAAAGLFALNAAVSTLTAPAAARAVLIMITDTILIMERAHWLIQEDVVDSQIITDACKYYAKSKQGKVHAEVKTLLSGFNLKETLGRDKLFAGVRIIVDKHRYKKVERPKEEEEDDSDIKEDEPSEEDEFEKEEKVEAS